MGRNHHAPLQNGSTLEQDSQLPPAKDDVSDMGRPRLHDGDIAIIVRLDKRLLKVIDAEAERQKLPRNTLMTRTLAGSFPVTPKVSDIGNQGTDPEGTNHA